MPQAKVYLNVFITEDKMKDAQDGIRFEMHVREARKLGLGVVKKGRRETVVSGPHDKLVAWLGVLDDLEVAYPSYEFILPPGAAAENSEDMWAKFLNDELGRYTVLVKATFDGSEDEWLKDLPGEDDGPITITDRQSYLDVEMLLVNLQGDRVAAKRVQEALELAGCEGDMIADAINLVRKITGPFSPSRIK